MTAPSPRIPALLVSILLAACAGGPPAPDAAPGPEADADARWTVRIQGNDAGEMTVRREGDEEVWHFTFNDRGRGPDITTRVELDDAGMPVATRTEGHDYLKVPVEETFVLDGTWSEGEVRWRGPSESGAKSVERPAFYLGTQSAAPEVALLARALVADPDGRIALLPEGEAVLDDRTTVTVASESGETREVTRVSIAGLGLAPTGVWLDLPDGDGSFFALSSGWFSMLPPGWEGAAETLQEVEDEKSAEWAAALASRLGERPDGGIALVGASVFDPATGEVTPGRTVVVEGNRIAAVGADGEVQVPAGARHIDARGKTVLPGLWDMHTHVSDLDGVLHLAAGVTTVRDLANDVEQLTEKRETWNDPEKGVGPRLILAGFLDGPGPFAGPTKALVSTEEEALEWIERYHELGYEQIKVYSSLDPELLPFIAREAHARDMRLSGHVPQGITARQAVELGFDELQHVNFLFLNFWADQEIDTRTPARFTEVAARGAELDLGSPEVEAFLRLLAERGIEVDPTVAVFEGMLLGRPGTLAPGYAAIADRMPPQVRRGLLGGGLEPPKGMDPTYRASYHRMVEMVGKLYEAGVPLVAGTDDFAGFAYHRELELYAEAGIPAPEVLRIATLGAAELTGRADRLGTVAAGKLADLIVVDGDPSQDISDIRNVRWTIKDGTLYDTAKLYEAVSIRP
jgi:hypothetical protein